MKVPYHRHNLGYAEITSMANTFSSAFLTGGPRVGEFEKDFAKFLGYPDARVIGVNSCTNALHLALLACGVKPGDYVVTTPLSFVATANAILYARAIPIFVEVDSKTGLISFIDLERSSTFLAGSSLRAILPVHLYGQMCDMKKIRTYADKQGLAVIEDSAHCVEGSRDGIRPGQLGDAACFSFHAIKTMTSGDGGAITVRNEEREKLLRELRSHGLSRSAVERQQDYSIQEMVELGYKYNMSDIQAAILLPQISLLEERRQRRARIDARYRDAFAGEPKIRMLTLEDDVSSSYSVFIILVNPEKRMQIVNSIREKGVEVVVAYTPIHLMPYYQKEFGYRRGDLPNAELIGDSNIALPIYPKLRQDEQDFVIKTVLEVIRRY